MNMNRFALLILTFISAFNSKLSAEELFPDGSPIPQWFRNNNIIDVKACKKHFVITDFGVTNDSTVIQTQKIQAAIDEAHQTGGGVIIIPKGTFLSGSLFFKPGTHLYLEEGATLKGSDDISNFPIVKTRMEGQTLDYFAALVNADHVDGFSISGKGTIDGNGLRYWKSFWLRRRVNPKCTNMDELRPRLVYVSNSKDVQLSDVRLMNSPFWTTHFYKCSNLKLINLHITSPTVPIKAPSTDAIDLDVCSNVLVKGCYMAVNDDAIALKGGKGPLADKDENNGENKNIVIEDCTYGFCHSALTCGSESIHSSNIIFRRCNVDGVQRLLHLKMRPDTPQNYEHILIEDIRGKGTVMLSIRPWTQFFDLKGQKDTPLSFSSNITMRNIIFGCDRVFDVVASDQYKLSGFRFINIEATTQKADNMPVDEISNVVFENVIINGKIAF